MAGTSPLPDDGTTAHTCGPPETEGSWTRDAPHQDLAALPQVDPRRYEEREILGQGGMGIVRLCWDRVLDCAVVRKEMRSHDAPAGRFVTEARVTARLQHPGILPVHDLARLPDGRLCYTMRQVRGVSLEEPLAELHALRPSEWSLRRLVEVFRRVCDTVAYAHSRGVVHRDLKPANLMVGEFGGVLVVDWGLAKVVGEPDVLGESQALGESDVAAPGLTGHGAILGTPAYMAPEQARGEEVGPPADVFALGTILHALLYGHPRQRLPGTEQAPAELAELCAACMAEGAGERPAAEAVAKGLGDWLEGLRRTERALAAVEEADALLPEIARLRSRARERRQEARALLEALPRGASPEDKQEGWAAEDAALALEEQAERQVLEQTRLLHLALREDPDLHEAHARLADHYQARHAAAEASRDGPGTLRYEALLRRHDRGRHAAWIQGHGALSLRTEPPGAEVVLHRLGLHGRRLRPEEGQHLGRAPLVERSLPRGSYLVELRAPGHHTVTYPVAVGRLEHWDGLPADAKEPVSIELPRLGSLAPGERLVPAGWVRVGGDDQALDPLPAGRRWVESFVLREHPLTHAELLALLNALVGEGREELALELAPRRRAGLGGDGLSYRFDGRRFALDPEQAGVPWQLDGPAVELSWHAAMGIARALAERSGLPWRLPHELEWEKAARGVDGRAFPWGDHFEPGWAQVLDSQVGSPAAGPVGHPPEDRSIYGVRGLVGNTRDWCLNAYAQAGLAEGATRVPLAAPAAADDAHRTTRGGTFSSNAALCRLATRTGARPGSRFNAVGLRLARPLLGGSAC